jgi:aminobenzoyl-glutamate transport protein
MRGSGSKANGRRGVLDAIERLGNALPDPVLLFIGLMAILLAVSAVAANYGLSAVHPGTGERLFAESLLAPDNLSRLLVDMPQTFVGFPPLGLIAVVMIGAAVADRSGLFAAVIGRAARRVPTRLLTPSFFFIALLSHQAADAAYVVLIPLAAMAYLKAGRHPLEGIAVTYAGISGAFAANLLPGQFDVLLLGITQSAAALIEPGRILNPLGNWWFTATLALLLLPVGWWVTERIVAPRLAAGGPPSPAVPAAANGAAHGEPVGVVATCRDDRLGLRQAGVSALAVVGLFAALALWPGDAPLRDESAVGQAAYAPFYESLVGGFMLLFLASGWAYGRAVGTIHSHRDVIAMMAAGIRELAPFFVLAFFAAHFIAMFSWSNLGPIIAIHGAEWLRGLELGPVLLLLPLLLVVTCFDLLIGSASAKWSVMAPIVVPMLMLLGITPEMTTAAFRVGDSIVNIITPVAANFVLVLVLCQRWDSRFGVGSLIALMLPYSIAFGLAGLLLVGLWAGFALPPGPGAPALMPMVVPP